MWLKLFLLSTHIEKDIRDSLVNSKLTVFELVILGRKWKSLLCLINGIQVEPLYLMIWHLWI